MRSLSRSDWPVRGMMGLHDVVIQQVNQSVSQSRHLRLFIALCCSSEHTRKLVHLGKNWFHITVNMYVMKLAGFCLGSCIFLFILYV